MPRSLVIALCAAVLGTVAALGLVESVLAKEKKDLEIGGVKVPIEVQHEYFDRGQLRIAAGSGALVAALIAVGLGAGFTRTRRRR